MIIPEIHYQTGTNQSLYNNHIFLAVTNFRENKPGNVAIILDEIDTHHLKVNEDY